MKAQTNRTILDRKFQRTLRKCMTVAETRLWQRLRSRQLAGFKFRRQHPYLDFILDFVCLERWLVIEVDGGQHLENERDQERDSRLQEAGFRVLRFWNNQVLQETDAVSRLSGRRYTAWQFYPIPTPTLPLKGREIKKNRIINNHKLPFVTTNTWLQFCASKFLKGLGIMLKSTFLKDAMRHLLTFILAFSCIAVILPTAHAAKTIKAAKPVKERLVLMPLRVPDEDKNLLGSMETALVQGMQQQYEIFSGEQVAAKAKAIFLKESRNTAKKECDETRCMQDIAIAFQAELIATANVTKRDGGYFLALSIQNIFDNKVVYSNSVACKGCDSFQVVDKLKELSGASVQASVALTDNSPTPARTIALPAVPTAPRVSGNSNDAETQVWAEMVAGNKIEDYKFYLDNYPQGKYAKQATEQKQKLEAYAKAKADAVVAQANEQAWNTAQQGNSVASYTQYLNQYPNGSYAALAKLKKNKVESAAAEAAISGIAMNMVAIPGKNYELGKYEVTQKEWRDVMGSNPSHFSKCGDTCPVEKVSWDDIQTFLQKLNAKTGRQYRLPTEAEWEYACYGGTKTEYCGGNDINTVAWYDSNSNQTTHPAGQKQANGYGLHDMSGNVWEWQSDCYDGNCAVGRVLRGGSWSFIPQFVRAAYRYWLEAAERFNMFGFRLARTLP